MARGMFAKHLRGNTQGGSIPSSSADQRMEMAKKQQTHTCEETPMSQQDAANKAYNAERADKPVPTVYFCQWHDNYHAVVLD